MWPALVQQKDRHSAGFSRKIVTPTFIPALYSARPPGAGRILCVGKGHCWRVILDDAICYKRNSKHRTQISSGKCGLDRTLSNNAIMGTKRSGLVFGHEVHAPLKSSSSSVIYRNKAIISITTTGALLVTRRNDELSQFSKLSSINMFCFSKSEKYPSLQIVQPYKQGS